MYRGISLKKDPPRPSRKGGSSASRTKVAKPSAMSFGRSMHLRCGSKQQGCVQCAEARFKNCKAAVQCPAGFQCSGAAVLSPLRYESVSKEPSAKRLWRSSNGSMSLRLCSKGSRRQNRGSKRVEPGDDIAENFFRDGFFDIAVFCGSTRLGMLE